MTDDPKAPAAPPDLGAEAGESVRASRLEYLQLGEEDHRHLSELSSALAADLDTLVDEWHGFLLARPETHSLLERGRVREHLKVVQTKYFVDLFSGPRDGEYFRNRMRIGSVHHKVGLEPPWYTGAYRKFMDIVRSALERTGYGPEQVGRWTASLEKVVYLDMQLALDAYSAAWNQELRNANAVLHRTAAELEARNRELSLEYARTQEAARIKEEFLSRVSHELRTPLNSVLGYADLLVDGIDGPVNEDQRSSLTKIRRHGERLLSMIDRMIDAARIAAAGAAQPEPFYPGPVITKVSRFAREMGLDRGLEFVCTVEEELPRVQGDEKGLELALRQLVENAMKFTPSGSVRLEARRLGPDVVRFTVRDTGPGVAPEHQQKIFEPFYQVDFGDVRTTSGLGMGLTLAQQVMVRMGGALSLLSSGPAGSTFAADLPTACAGP
jgi:signal transduction histidine kinase